MPRKAQPCELNKSVFRDREMADAVAESIQAELNEGTYGCEKARRAREHKLNSMYTALFADKSRSVFNFSQIDSMLKSGTEKDMLRIFHITIYLLKRGELHDDKLKRLLSFQHRFTTQGVLYSDFDYLMHSEIYDTFISESAVMDSGYAEKLFFSTCRDLGLYDEEILNITNEWCEKVKADSSFTPATRCGRLPQMHNLAKKLFSSRSIDEIRRTDMADIEEVYLLFEYLEFIDQKHKLSKDICHMFSFKDLMTAKGSLKFKEMCQTENIFQYVGIRGEEKHRRICKLDIPYGTALFEDMVGFIRVSPYCNEAFTIFIENFYRSMGDYAVTDTTQLSMNALRESSRFFQDKKKEKYYWSYLYSFYNYCYDKYRINFFEKEGIDIALIKKEGLIQRLNDGYAVVKYNPFDRVPEEDKWIVCYNPEYDTGTEHSPTKTIVMDFSDIQNDLFRKWVKEYVWRADKALKAKRTVSNVLAEGLNYIHRIRTRQIIVIYCRKTSPLDGPLTQSEMTALRKMYISQGGADATIHSKIYNFRAFLQFLDDYGITPVPSGLYYHLYHQQNINNTSKAIPQKDLEALTGVITKNAEKSVINDLFAVIYMIALDTSLRISTILSLKKDCLAETAKQGEYVIVARSKDATIEEIQEPITKETKRMIDHAIAITEGLRRQAQEHIRSRLFIVPQKGSVSVRALNRNNFCIYLKKCCRQAGIDEYTSANLRDTHMTMAKAYQIKKRLSNLELSALTGHKTPDVDLEHYVDMDITTMMEALHGVIIGNVDIKGRVMNQIPEDVATQENEVSSGCGYCQSEYCKNLTYLDCIMCKDFVTMPSRLPFFEEQIRQMDINIKKAVTPHDKEDYVNIKRLLVAYESALKSIEVK